MQLTEFDYHLPRELIASEPLSKREASRMLHLDRAQNKFTDRQFTEFPTLIRPGDVLVLNNTKVFPARFIGKTDTGGTVEVLLEEEIETSEWLALAKPAKRLKPGKRITFSPDFSCEVLEKVSEGHFRLAFDSDVWHAAEMLGHIPLPHYIERPERASDRDRYQTVFASERGAIAAPTAGLHFSEAMLETLREIGVEVVELTLHVGYGTFEPVRVEDPNDHRVMPERFELSEDAAQSINKARNEGRRIVAVGTTTTRALESAIGNDNELQPQKTKTSLTVTPGYKFKVINALLTNFHLPKSSLLILVSTFGGHEFIMRAYEHAVASGYRFYSYGDCMFIE